MGLSYGTGYVGASTRKKLNDLYGCGISPKCIDKCGNGVCDEVVCQGTGCPCAETKTSCPEDCSSPTQPTISSIQSKANDVGTVDSGTKASIYGTGLRGKLTIQLGNQEPKYVYVTGTSDTYAEFIVPEYSQNTSVSVKVINSVGVSDPYTLNIIAQPTLLPDLYVTKLSVYRIDSSNVGIDYCIKNNGDADTGKFSLKFSNLDNINWDFGGANFDSFVVGREYCSKITSSGVVFDGGNGYVSGDNRIKVIVDSNSEVVELNESNNEQVSVFNTSSSITDKTPVITGVSGPTNLNTNQAGTWTIKAYDPNGTYLSYSVDWGVPATSTEGTMKALTNVKDQSATFSHSYSVAGVYTITFKVSDSQGLSAKSSITVNVDNSTTSCIDSDGEKTIT